MHETIKVVASAAFLTLTCPFWCVVWTGHCIWEKCKGVAPYDTRRANNARCSAKRKLLDKESPRPVQQRKRALTLPLQAQKDGILRLSKQQRTEDQQQSVFLSRFPYEIREMIYEVALAGSIHMHIFRRTDRRLGHYKCHTRHRSENRLLKPNPKPSTSSSPEPCRSLSGAWITGRFKDREARELVPLLRTCRRV